MVKLQPDTDAAKINELINHPGVYEVIRGTVTEALDMSALVGKAPHVVMTCDHAGMIFICHQPGMYELHSVFLPQQDRVKSMAWARDVFDWMFTHTDACEIITKCPQTNPAAKMAAIKNGFLFEWLTRPLWPSDDFLVPFYVYSLRIERWAQRATHMQALGHSFHDALHSQYADKGMDIVTHAEDLLHDQYVGIAVAMMVNPFKAADFYNRWAVMNGYAKMFIEELQPLIINITESRLRLGPDQTFEVL